MSACIHSISNKTCLGISIPYPKILGYHPGPRFVVHRQADETGGQGGKLWQAGMTRNETRPRAINIGRLRAPHASSKLFKVLPTHHDAPFYTTVHRHLAHLDVSLALQYDDSWWIEGITASTLAPPDITHSIRHPHPHAARHLRSCSCRAQCERCIHGPQTCEFN